ncbi:MAG TPA: hypothetical protein VFR70_07905, partial [Flavobacterium sp.]|nr:hypothetical protein [Flavobacterium sp.]
IYTHLKPETNSRLPRKDMLDILSQFAGFSGWDEFKFKNRGAVPEEKGSPGNSKNRKTKAYGVILIVVLPVIATLAWFFNRKPALKFQLKNEFTNETIQAKDIRAYKIENNEKVQIAVKNATVVVAANGKGTKLVLESPYYKKKEISVSGTSNTDVLMKPDDFAMMLKAFMKSDIKGWEERKIQLDKILATDLEVILMLKNDLGSAYYDKKEFSQMLVIPTESVRKMEIVEIRNDASGKIEFIRIKQ